MPIDVGMGKSKSDRQKGEFLSGILGNIVDAYRPNGRRVGNRFGRKMGDGCDAVLKAVTLLLYYYSRRRVCDVADRISRFICEGRKSRQRK